MPERLDAQLADGTLTLRDAQGATLLTARAEVRLADSGVIATPHPSLEWDLADDPPAGVILRLRFRNDTASAVRVEQLRPLVSTDGLRAARVSELAIYQCGWQSWSRSHPSAPFESNLESAGPPIRGPYLPHRSAESQLEPWMTIVSARGVTLLLGFVSARSQLGTLELIPTSSAHTIVAATELDGIPLAPGAELVSEPLLIACGDEAELLDLYAARTGREMEARPQTDVLSGWCSWYQLYTTVSEADVDRNLASLDAQRDRLPLRLIQLDDGYQHEIGDWLHLNDKFPSGMPALVERITHHGYVPGVWLAPFLLSERSETYAAHPRWVVRDEHGAPLNALNNWGSANYALDTTHPEALDWLAHVIETVCSTWGYRYLKLDFLYAAAMRGQRHDASATGVQAYRRGLELLRRVAGDRFVLGCGAPLLPSIGLVDGMRIGSDVAAFWGDEGNSDGPSLRNATRATLARMWMHGRWWTNDPDCVVIRASDTDLSLAEVQGWLSAVALSGGMLFAGDDVSRVESDRLDMLSRLIPPSGVAASALPPLAQSIPQRLHLRVERPHGAWSVVGIANWSDTTVRAELRLADFGLSGRYHVVDLWTGAYLGRTATWLDLAALPPHAMRLLSLHPDTGRPQTIGSTGHLLGDVVDLASEEWNANERVLTLFPSGTAPPARKAEFVVYAPNAPLQRIPFSGTDTSPIRVPFA